MNDETRHAFALLARTDELLRARPRFNMADWNARRPDPEDRNAWKAWLAELPNEPPPETAYERSVREDRAKAAQVAKAREKEREERARKRREAFAAAPRQPARSRLSAPLNAPAWANPGAAKFVVKAPLGPVTIRKVIRMRPPGGSDA